MKRYLVTLAIGAFIAVPTAAMGAEQPVADGAVAKDKLRGAAVGKTPASVSAGGQSGVPSSAAAGASVSPGQGKPPLKFNPKKEQ